VIEGDGNSFYAGLLDKIIRFVESRKAPVDPAESLEAIAFLEAANASRRSGEWVSLDVG
jgi:hypothetical protein